MRGTLDPKTLYIFFESLYFFLNFTVIIEKKDETDQELVWFILKSKHNDSLSNKSVIQNGLFRDLFPTGPFFFGKSNE